MKNKQKGFTLAELLVVILILVCAYGWVANIVRAVSVINAPITGLELFRFLGVPCAPLGVVLGYIPN